jgi:hypothetical protein
MSRTQRALDSPENADLCQQKKNKRGLHYAERERHPPKKRVRPMHQTNITQLGIKSQPRLEIRKYAYNHA